MHTCRFPSAAAFIPHAAVIGCLNALMHQSLTVHSLFADQGPCLFLLFIKMLQISGRLSRLVSISLSREPGWFWLPPNRLSTRAISAPSQERQPKRPGKRSTALKPLTKASLGSASRPAQAQSARSGAQSQAIFGQAAVLQCSCCIACVGLQGNAPVSLL